MAVVEWAAALPPAPETAPQSVPETARREAAMPAVPVEVAAAAREQVAAP